MNKSFLLLGLASVMSAFTGCTTDETDNITIPEPQSTSPQTLVAQFQDEGSTRVEMAPNGRTVRWSAGDAIAVYSADNATKKIRYMLKSGFEGQGVGEFQLVPDQTGNITLASYGEYDGLEEKTYVAVYPSTQFYQKQFMTTSPLELGATIPAKQKYVEGSFDPKALPMMAVFNTDTPDQNPPSLKFKYMGGLIQLPIVAPTNGTLESVKVSVGKVGRLAGTTYYQFYKSMFGNDKAGRDACFTDMTQPMNYLDEGRYIALQNDVTLTGPIPVSSTPTNLMFGVLPFNYATNNPQGGVPARTLTFQFQYDDGSVVEKETASGKDLAPGDMAVLPTYNLDVPYMPVATVSNGVLSWDGNENIAYSYQVVVLDWGEPLTTVDIWYAGQKDENEKVMDPVTSVDIAKVIWPALDEFVGSSFKAGEELDFDLQVKVVYNADNKKVADAVYSVPVAAPTYTAPVPEIVWSYGSGTASDYITISNYSAYSKIEWARVFLDHPKPATEADFANATFTATTSRNIYVPAYPEEVYGTYAYMLKATGGATVKTTFVYHEVKEPVAPTQEIEMSVSELMLDIKNINNLVSYYKPTDMYIVWKKGTWTQKADFDDVKDTQRQNLAANQFISGPYDLVLAMGDAYDDEVYSLLFVMEAPKLDNGELSGITQFTFSDPWW